jgi:hypothetical protein
MDTVYIYKCRYEIQEQKQVSIWYTGTFREVLHTEIKIITYLHLIKDHSNTVKYVTLRCTEVHVPT